MNIKFTKIQAYGNDFVYIWKEDGKLPDENRLAKTISDRHFGVGADGVVLVSRSKECDFQMQIFNHDGTEAQMCGNALRGTAMYAYFHKITKKTTITIETNAGIKIVHLMRHHNKVANIHAVIGRPEFDAKKIPVISDQAQFINQPRQVADKIFSLSSVSWGNPHTVVYVEEVEAFDVEKYGSAIAKLECFQEGTNVTFAEIIDKKTIKIREWERGVGETLGCGTGCCSAVVISNMLGKAGRDVSVIQPGGILQVLWDKEGLVHMTGPCTVVCQGEYWYGGKQRFISIGT